MFTLVYKSDFWVLLLRKEKQSYIHFKEHWAWKEVKYYHVIIYYLLSQVQKIMKECKYDCNIKSDRIVK